VTERKPPELIFHLADRPADQGGGGAWRLRWSAGRG